MNDRYLIDIAKDAILEEFENRHVIDKDLLLKKYPLLSRKGAVFVTLKKNRNLRGCVGSLVAHRSLLDDIISNAKSAAFRDNRFRPLRKNEFEDKNFSVEISILSEPKFLKYKDAKDLSKKIRAKVDGVILKYGRYRATYLPQVWEQLPRFDSFFTNLCKKAGLSGNCLDIHPEIYLYQVKKIS